MAKDLLTIRCPDDLREAIEQRMHETSKGKTEVVVELLRSALGIESKINSDVSYLRKEDLYNDVIPMLYENILAALNQHMIVLIEQQIEKKLAPLQKQIEMIDVAFGEYKSKQELVANNKSIPLQDDKAIDNKNKQETKSTVLHQPENNSEYLRDMRQVEVQSKYDQAARTTGIKLTAPAYVRATPGKMEPRIKEDAIATQPVSPNRNITEPTIPTEMTQKNLAARLGVSEKTIQRNKTADNFAEWSKNRDPDDIPWELKPDLLGKTPKFQPLP